MIKGLRGFIALLLFFAVMTGATVPTFARDAKLPQQVISKMETNLLKIKNRKLKFRLEATGFVNAVFEGEIVFKKGNVIDYRTAGKFAGKEHKLFLACDGAKLRGGAESKPFEIAAPAELRSGLLIGLTRMGLMHNIARLTGNQPPEKTDGTVYKWLSVVEPKFAKEPPVDTPQASAEVKVKNKDLMVVFFTLAVDGKNTADVELWIDTKTDLPSSRTITVRFPQGNMIVNETYEWSKIS